MTRRCPDCGEPVIRARTEAMKWQLLDPQPSPDGNVHARESNGNWYARSVQPRTAAIAPERLMMPHAATCRKRLTSVQQEPPEGITFLDAFRRAKASQGKAQRNRRGTRAQPKAAGYRVRRGDR